MNLGVVRIEELLNLARGRRASDLHLNGADPPTLREHGRVTPLEVPALGGDALTSFIERVLPAALAHRWHNVGAVDAVCRSGAGAPYRLHAYRTIDGPRLAFRLLAAGVPCLDALALPDVVASLAERPHGLVLFTGPTGSGKTTALAALVDRVNRNAGRVIVTVEDPVEYVHTPVRSVIAHCEIGTHIDDYASAVYGFMRADPDVILVGEMRDRATMEAVLCAAETGHLVFSTLHTNDAVQTVDRIIDAFTSETQMQARTQLAATLVAVVSLRLVPTTAGDARVAATEILVGTDAVRAMIRDGKTHQLRNALATGRAAGMRTLETSLSDLVVRRVVSIEAARHHANRPAEVRDLERVAG
jgi:twitching motility protein PilT